jgi:hypothetical protein
MKHLRLAVSLLLFGCLLPSASAGAAAGGKSLHQFVAKNKLYALWIPAQWAVHDETQSDSFRVLAESSDRVSAVEFYWQRRDPGGPDILRLLGQYRAVLCRRHADAIFSDVRTSGDGARAVVGAQYRAGRRSIRGKLYFETGPAGFSVQGYFAPEERLGADRPLLLNVMASFAFVKGHGGGPAPAPAPSVVDLPLTQRRAPDGSLSIATPADWNFHAGGGKVVSGAPNGAMGFIFTTFQGNPMLPRASIAQGVIGSGYRPPDQTLATIFQGFGHRDFRVLSAQPDQQTTREFAARLHRSCDAQDFLVSWTSSKGAACVGAFKVVNAQPSVTGQWFSMVSGIWGPQSDFNRYHSMLEKVANSFSINDQYARQQIQAGLNNLRQLQQKTAASMQDLRNAREQNQADWEARQARKDFMDSKWDDYRRGRSYWVSDLEGGKVYETDSHGTRDTATGDYYEGRGYNWVNFEGQNPNHPSEVMREVSSGELQQLNGRR